MHRGILIGSAAAMLAAGLAPAQAAPMNQSGWYAGLDVARDRLGMGGSSIDQAFASQGITSAASINRARTGWGLDAGYRFGPHFALEGGYTELGKYGYTSAATAPAVDTVNGTFKARAWWLAPVGIAPLTDQWSLFGKAGVTHVTADLSASSSTGATAPGSMSRSNTGWLLGAGATYDFTHNVYARLEWDRFARVGDANTTGRGDINQVGIGVGVRF